MATTAFAAVPSRLTGDRSKLPETGSYTVTLNPTAIKFLKEFDNSGVIKEIQEDASGKIKLNHSDTAIESTYGLDNSFMQILHTAVNDMNSRIASASDGTTSNESAMNHLTSKSSVKPMIFVSGWRIYFTNSNVNTLLLSAAEAGPVAMDLALDSIATITGGPVGTIISVILDVVGAATIANLCYLVIQADYYDEGVYIGISWNGPFPNYEQGLWAD